MSEVPVRMPTRALGKVTSEWAMRHNQHAELTFGDRIQALELPNYVLGQLFCLVNNEQWLLRSEMRYSVI